MTNWLRLRDISKGRPDGVNPDVVLQVLLSPYDVPEAVRGFRTGDGKIRIEFRYIDGDEPVREQHVDKHLLAFEGRHSGRLLAMEFDIEASGASTCGVSIATDANVQVLRDSFETAWKRFYKAKSGSSEKARLANVAKKAFETREEDLYGQLVNQ